MAANPGRVAGAKLTGDIVAVLHDLEQKVGGDLFAAGELGVQLSKLGIPGFYMHRCQMRVRSVGISSTSRYG